MSISSSIISLVCFYLRFDCLVPQGNRRTDDGCQTVICTRSCTRQIDFLITRYIYTMVYVFFVVPRESTMVVRMSIMNFQSPTFFHPLALLVSSVLKHLKCKTILLLLAWTIGLMRYKENYLFLCLVNFNALNNFLLCVYIFVDATEHANVLL